MTANDTGQFLYLILLLVAVGGYFLIGHRESLGKLAQQAAVWGLIFLGAIAIVGLWGDIRNDLAPRQSVFEGGGRIEVPRNYDGHYYLTADVNGTPVNFVVDTGATDMVLSRQDARRVGLDPENLPYTGSAGTANGIVRTAPVQLDAVSLGGVTERGLRAWVNEGEMDRSLMGMSYLQRFEKVEIGNGTLVLTR